MRDVPQSLGGSLSGLIRIARSGAVDFVALDCATAEYRAYVVGGDGHFVSFEGFACNDDGEAIAKAQGVNSGPPHGAERNSFHPIVSLKGGKTHEETTMKIKTIALASALALSTTLAFAQTSNTAAGDSKAGGPAASGTAMKDGAAPAASSKPSGKDASTQGASTAGSAEKKGDAASPGGTMKQ